MRRIKTILIEIIFACLIFSPLVSYAQTNPEEKDKAIEETFSRMEANISNLEAQQQESLEQERTLTEQPKSLPLKEYLNEQPAREQEIENTMRKLAIEISPECFFVRGKQKFELINSFDGSKVSQLIYPLRGEIPIIKGEIKFPSRVSIGGKFATSYFRKTICTDEDWNIGVDIDDDDVEELVNYQITRQYCKSKVEFYDLDLYYNLFDSDQDSQENFFNSKRLHDNLLINKLSFDLFAGYQNYKGRYRAVDPMTEYLLLSGGLWYEAMGLPADIGLNSFYKIQYQGPRLGFRAAGTVGKVLTRISFAAAWLKTEAFGWWNLRPLRFWQKGDGGLGTDLEIEVVFKANSSFSAGFGYNYFAYHQGKLKCDWLEPPDPLQPDLDIVRNADCSAYGPTFILKYKW